MSNRLIDALDGLLKPPRKADAPEPPQIEEETTEFDFGEAAVDAKTVFFGDDSILAEVMAGGERQEQSGVVYTVHEPDEGKEIRTNSGDLDLIHAIEEVVDTAFHHHMQQNAWIDEINKALAPERLVMTQAPGAQYWRGGQFTIPLTNSVNAERLCERRNERRSITLINTSGSTVLVSDSSAVNPNSMRLASGSAPLTIATRGEIWLASATGTPAIIVDWFELFDAKATK